MNPLVIDIKNIAQKTALDRGFQLVGLDLNTHLNPMTIQLQIRPKGGGDVSLDDCALLSSPISDAFDNSQLLNKPYVLEISSPGINDLLENDRDFQTFKGFPVEVILNDDNQSTKLKKTGLLHEKSKEHLKLNLKGKISIFPIKSIIQVKLINPKG